MKVPYTITNSAISVLVDNRMRVIDATSMNFDTLRGELRKPDHDIDLIRDLADIVSFIARKTFGAVQIADGGVRWNGVAVHNVVAERLIDMLHAGHDVEPLANFLGRLMQNPLETARDELYLWLESGNAPITPDGYFLAFKKVNANYTDIHTGTMDNSVGQTVQMPRERVDPNRYNECSVGLHFCSWGYLRHFGSASGSRVVILKIDPANVVAIPKDYNNQKGRTWIYEVVGEVPEEEAKQFFEGRPVVELYQPYQPPPGADDNDDGELVTENDDDDDDDDGFAFGVGFDLGDDDVDNTIADDDADANAPDDVTEAPADEPEPSGDDALVEASLPAPEDDTQDDTATPELTKGKPELLFQSAGRSFMAHEVLSLIKEHGQRGMQRLTGVPRTTIQTWVAAIAKQAA